MFHPQPAGLAGHRSAVETFDRLGYSPARRMAAAVAELLSATGVLLGAVFRDMTIGVSGTVAANSMLPLDLQMAELEKLGQAVRGEFERIDNTLDGSSQ